MVRFNYNGKDTMTESNQITIFIQEGTNMYQGKDPYYISQFSLNEVVKFRLKDLHKDVEQLATVRGIHFYDGKVKYDLALWLGNGSVDDPEWETRIYNVDSILVEPV